MLGYGAAQKFLRTEDVNERFELQALAHAARQIESEADERRAIQIANAVGKLFSPS